MDVVITIAVVMGSFFALFGIFHLLERCRPVRPGQKAFREGFWWDIFYLIVNQFLLRYVVFGVFYIIVIPFHYYLEVGLIVDSVRSQPEWLQYIEAFVTLQLGGYFAHRLAHTVPCLWRFHAIHHSMRQMDWIAGIRLHLVDAAVLAILGIAPVVVLGFTFTQFAVVDALQGFHGLLLHSNIRCGDNNENVPEGGTNGCFKGILGTILCGPWWGYCIATTRFHHIHHSGAVEDYDKNYVGCLVPIDMIFCSYHMPKEHWPRKYGVDEPIAHNYFKAFLHPFKFWRWCKCCFRDFKAQWDIEANMTAFGIRRNRLRVAAYVTFLIVLLQWLFILSADPTQLGSRVAARISLGRLIDDSTTQPMQAAQSTITNTDAGATTTTSVNFDLVTYADWQVRVRDRIGLDTLVSLRYVSLILFALLAWPLPAYGYWCATSVHLIVSDESMEEKCARYRRQLRRQRVVLRIYEWYHLIVLGALTAIGTLYSLVQLPFAYFHVLVMLPLSVWNLVVCVYRSVLARRIAAELLAIADDVALLNAIGDNSYGMWGHDEKNARKSIVQIEQAEQARDDNDDDDDDDEADGFEAGGTIGAHMQPRLTSKDA